jgi:hypothetical protein
MVASQAMLADGGGGGRIESANIQYSTVPIVQSHSIREDLSSAGYV